MKVSVVGTGYVGLVTGVVLADLGNDVVCVDKDREKVAGLQRGESPIFEPGIEELLKKTIAAKTFSATTSIRDAVLHAEVVFIAVGTPSGPDGGPDLTAVKQVAKEIGQSIDKPIVVVNKSTVPVGSGDLVERIILEQGVDPELVTIVSNPEFLREGSAISDTMHPDRIVIGARDREAAEKLIELYEPLNAPIMVTDINSAEMIKYASNSYLATKISFINAIGRLCEECGADVAEVARGIGQDKRIGTQFLRAGLGWGGSCFPKDVDGMISIAAGLGYDFDLLKATKAINAAQVPRFMRRLKSELGGFEGKTVALLGLSFKPNTNDVRDAKSLEIIDCLFDGGAKIRAYDPVAMPAVHAKYPAIVMSSDAYDAADGADALILVTEWKEFRQLDLGKIADKMRGRILFDGRRVYSREAAESAGLRYSTIGAAPVQEES